MNVSTVLKRWWEAPNSLHWCAINTLLPGKNHVMVHTVTFPLNLWQTKCVPVITNLTRDQGLGSVCVRNCHPRLGRIMITFTLICSKYLIVFPFNLYLYLWTFVLLLRCISSVKLKLLLKTYCTLFCQIFKIIFFGCRYNSHLLNCFLKDCVSLKDNNSASM